MTDNELLETMKTLLKDQENRYYENMKQMLKPIKDDLEMLEIKVDTLALNQKATERTIRKDINMINDTLETIQAIMEIRGIIPKAK